ncbi:hypothetical protein NLG97_g9006 [Lecanicillium saksenae]|uniref:Uncharacterized protein n=1 Tax=Lecanicillium saksenae TaxID=468837 RepID=A0ACC1QIX7_9HYPO|nr:hypothetical protein NLG97_g9006 [Lecanicillium saksenae]
MQSTGPKAISADRIVCGKGTVVGNSDSKRDVFFPDLVVNDPNSPIIRAPDIMMINHVLMFLSFQISRYARSETVQAICSSRGGIKGMEQRYSRYAGLFIQEFTGDVGKIDQYLKRKVIRRLAMLIDSEININAPTLPLHLRGFSAVLFAVGGSIRAVDMKAVAACMLQQIMLTIVSISTTSCGDQILGDTFPTEEDISLYYAANIHSSFPCPTDLFYCINDINSLRRQLSSRQLQTGINFTAIDGLLAKISKFQPENWTERYEVPAAVRVPAARVYKAATTLYAMVSLSGHMEKPFSPSERIAEADRLLRLIEGVSKIWGSHIALAWPLTVAGASLGRAGTSQQRAVDRALLAVSQSCGASAGLYLALECLRKFWASGATEWDDCFVEWQCVAP